jgi:hypothetical protein
VPVQELLRLIDRLPRDRNLAPKLLDLAARLRPDPAKISPPES